VRNHRAACEEYVVHVPYCTPCSESVLRRGTLQIAAGLAGLLIGVSLLLSLPRLASPLSPLNYALSCGVASLLPALILWAVRVPADQEAAWWARPGTLLCTNSAWAKDLAQMNGTQAHPMRLVPPILKVPMSFGALLAAGAAPLLYGYLHPVIVVLNLGASDFELWADDASLGEVSASVLESPAAATRVRLGVGWRHLVARDPGGATLAQRRVELDAGETYLYAPLSSDYCFWLERDEYGRSAEGRRYEPLPVGREFWALPEHIDSWFATNPPVAGDRRSTGGSLTALRQGPCTERPPQIPR